MVYAAIELINVWDLENARRYIIGEEEVRRYSLTMLAEGKLKAL